MPDRNLSNKEKALVAVAVLLDGAEAAAYLRYDSVRGEVLAREAQKLAEYPLEMRMPFVGTILRTALEESE